MLFRIVHAKKNAKMETLVPAPTFVVFKLLQVVVIIMAVHLMEYKPLVDQVSINTYTQKMIINFIRFPPKLITLSNWVYQ